MTKPLITRHSIVRKFFKDTKSKPKDLINWIWRWRKEKHPCLEKLYMDKFTFYPCKTMHGYQIKNLSYITSIWDILYYYQSLKTKKKLTEYIMDICKRAGVK